MANKNIEKKLQEGGFEEVRELVSDVIDGKEIIGINDIMSLLNHSCFTYDGSTDVKIVRACDIGRGNLPFKYILFKREHYDTGC